MDFSSTIVKTIDGVIEDLQQRGKGDDVSKVVLQWIDDYELQPTDTHAPREAFRALHVRLRAIAGPQ